MLLETIDITKNFGGVQALNSVNIGIKEGQIVGIIGPNGAGKTTLFNVITGCIKASRGEIWFNGEDITRLRTFEICHRGIARTYQIVKPFGALSVLDNIVVGALARSEDEREAIEKASEIAEFVGLQKKANLPAHILTIAELKRLELAKALATEPKLLLLDEVMAGLTSVEIDEALRLIREINASGVTIMMIEHVVKAVMKVSNNVLVIHHGSQLAEGKGEEILRNEKVLSVYLGRRKFGIQA